MKRALSGALFGLGFMAVMAATPAAAQVATYQGSFSAAYTSAGLDPLVEGTFSVTYDDTVDTFGTANSIDITVDNGGPHYTTAKFIYQPAFHQLIIATDCSDTVILSCGLASGVDQFELTIRNLSSAWFDYTYAGAPSSDFYTSDVTLDIKQTPGSAVPEPTVWTLMIVGFAGLGFAARRRRAAAV